MLCGGVARNVNGGRQRREAADLICMVRSEATAGLLGGGLTFHHLPLHVVQ